MKHQIAEELLDQVVNVNLPLGALLSLNGNNNTGDAPIGTRVTELRARRPNIGEKGLHGIYAGIARGYPDTPHSAGDGILEVLDGEFEGTWKDAIEWADKQGGRLPTRKEQALLFANVPDLFKQEYYWSCEQHADDSASAWGQSFSDGYQLIWRTSDRSRARAVRRLPI